MNPEICECWENIDSGHDEDLNLSTHRLQVFGGWIVRSINAPNNSMAMVFVPDPEHIWREGVYSKNDSIMDGAL